MQPEGKGGENRKIIWHAALLVGERTHVYAN